MILTPADIAMLQARQQRQGPVLPVSGIAAPDSLAGQPVAQRLSGAKASPIGPGSARRIGGRKAQRGGSAFQQVIVVSASMQRNLLQLEELPSCGARFVGRGKVIRQHMPCDFIGTMAPSGQAIYFDAKSLGEDYASFPLTNREMVKANQIHFLCRMGQAGALAGILAETKRAGLYLWLDWVYLNGRERIPWDDARWKVLGSIGKWVYFSKLEAK